MFIRSLRIKIAINLAILLLLAMVLIDLVSMVTIRRELIQAETARANLLIDDLADAVFRAPGKDGTDEGAKVGSIVNGILNSSPIRSAFIVKPDGAQVYVGHTAAVSRRTLADLTNQAISAGEKKNRFIGTTWGIFRNQIAHLILSAPVAIDGIQSGGVSIVVSLGEVAGALAEAQQLLFIYMAVNLVILTCFGIYRISRLYVSPLARLAQRAEDYKEDDDIIFSVRRQDNELNRLSKALNLMLKRISADKEKLRLTVTSLEKANQDLKRAQREIIQAEKLASVGRLSAGIAHEIGNPIGIVMGYLDLLKQADISGKERSEYIQRTEAEIERINTIIRQLLEVSRPSYSGRLEVSVHDLILDTAAVLRVQPLMADIELALDLCAEKDMVLADPNQLRQVFLNLTINAADAVAGVGAHNGGRLKIATSLDTDDGSGFKNAAGRLQIMFSDNGSGIAAENLDNIFDPFFTTKDPGKGTGLGLSVSFMIVESLGGRMTVASEVGQGTTMTITLPVME